jgi:hypothetical protein
MRGSRKGLVWPFPWWSCTHQPHESARIWNSYSLPLVLHPLPKIFDSARDVWFDDLISWESLVQGIDLILPKSQLHRLHELRDWLERSFSRAAQELSVVPRYHLGGTKLVSGGILGRFFVDMFFWTLKLMIYMPQEQSLNVELCSTISLCKENNP